MFILYHPPLESILFQTFMCLETDLWLVWQVLFPLPTADLMSVQTHVLNTSKMLIIWQQFLGTVYDTIEK